MVFSFLFLNRNSMKSLTKILVFMLLISSNLFAQVGRGKITAAEYYWDTEPGQGLGIAMSLQGNPNDAIRTAVRSSSINLSAGLHTFNIRMQDSLGHWGTVFTSVMSVENAITARNISASIARVYWDTNLAGATALIIFNGNATNAFNSFVQSTPINSFATAGLHTLSVQVRDNTGQYSPPFTTVVSVENLITARTLAASFARVYWDGNSASATGLIFLNGNSTNAINSFVQSSAIATFSISGLHTLSVEVMDNTGHYSPAFTTAISVEKQIKVDRSIKVIDGRVWYDANVPSLPNMIAFDGAFNDAFETAFKSLAAPSTGMHTINIQLRDSANGWGPTFTTALSVEGPIAYRNINISAGQFYWDNDTTQNTTTLLAFDGAFDNAIESVYKSSIALMPVGLHNLCVRVIDVAGNWGKAFTTAISIENAITARDLKVVEGEVSIDNFPPLIVIGMNGNFGNAIEQAQTTLLSNGIPTGLHKLNVRMKGRDSNWGSYFTTALLVSPCASTPTPIVTNQRPLSFCNGDSTVLIATPGFNSYQWVNNNAVVSTASSITVKNSGSYIVIATDATNCPGASSAVIVDKHNPIVNITSNAHFCQGKVDSLIATSGFQSYQWTGGATTSKMVVNNGGLYAVTVSDLLGCTGTSSVNINMLTQPATPIITSSGPVAFCPGTILTLSCASVGNLLWSTGLTTSSISTDSSSSYNVVVTNANGCSTSSQYISTHKFPLAVASISSNGPTTFCADSRVNLTANLSASYNWSNGATTQSILVNSSGNYNVAIVDSDGCTANSLVTSIIVNPLPPIPNVTSSGALSFCNGGAVTLSSNSSTNNLWNNGVITSSQYITLSGVFVDTVFNQYGCKAWSTPIVVDVHPVATISANGPLTFCADASVQLTAHPNSGVSYLWFNGSTSPSINVNITNDSAWVIVTEIAGGCNDTTSVNIHVNPLPIGVITPNGSTTFCSGSAVTFNTSGDPHTKYQWYQNGQPLMYAVWNIYSSQYVYYHVEGYSFTATSSGSFSAMDIDTLTGCTLMTNAIVVLVNSAAQPVISANGGTTLCVGANTLLSSTSAITYQWSQGSSAQLITAAVSGYYTVTITDGNGCTNTSVPTLVSFHPTASINSSGPTTFCLGGNVNLTAQPLGTYLWSNGSTSASINGIATAGTYTVSVTDVNGCSSISSPTSINVNPLPNGSISAGASTTVCQGNFVSLNTLGDPNSIYHWYLNGSVILYASYNYQSGQTYYLPISGYTYNIYVSGTYSAEIIDTLTGCSRMTNSIVVNVVPLPLIHVTQSSSILCFGGNGAALTASGMGTVAPYNYSWNTGSTTASISSLVAAIYTVEVTDNIGCKSDTAFNITQPTAVNPSLLSPKNTRGYNTSCYGVADASVSILAGGTSPYTYLWNTNATTSTISNVGLGSYSVTISDANGCIGIGTISLIEPPVVTLSFSSATYIGGNEIRCHGERGAIAAHPSGGTGPFTYHWSDTQLTQIADTLFAGNYSVIVADSEGCSVSGSFTLHEPGAMVSTLTALDHNGYSISCYGLSDGAINSIINGGNLVYHYWWNDSIATPNRNSLQVGTYQLLVTDTNGCQLLDSIRLTQPTQITTHTIGSTLNCFGDSNGSASVVALGGDPSYTYKWSTNATGSAISNLSAATYIITVTDSRGCSVIDNAVVNQPPQLIAYAFGTYIGCGSQIGLLSGTAAGGVAPYGYQWSNGSTADYQINLSVGNYSLTVTDSHGCLDTAATIILNPPILVSSFNVVMDSVKSILSVNVSGGVSPYMYLWSDGKSTPSDTVPNTHPSGIYSVIVTDANGCTSRGSAFVVGTGCTIHQTISHVDVSCKGGSNGNASTFVTGAIGPISYVWNTSGLTTSSITGLVAGKYYLQVSDSIGCVNTDSVIIAEPSSLLVTALPSNLIICHGGNSIVSVSATGGKTPYLSGIGTFSQVAGNTHYIVVDQNGCSAFADINLNDPGLLQATISSNKDTICNGDNVTITFTGPANGSVKYQVNSNPSTLISLNILGSATLTLNAITSNTIISLLQVDSASCSNVISQIKTINVTPLSPWYCDADHDGYSNGTFIMACTSPGINYSLSLINSTIDCNDSNSTIHPFALEVCGNFIDDNCNGIIDEGCIGSCTNAPTAFAGNDTIICAGTNILLHGSIGGSASNATWTTSGTGSFTPSSASLNAIYNPSTSDYSNGSVILTLTTNAALPCSSGIDQMNVLLQALPTDAGIISGTADFCNPSSAFTTSYSVGAVLGASTYTWSVPPGVTILSGQGTTAIAISFINSYIHNGVGGLVGVKTKNSFGCVSSLASIKPISAQLTIPVQPGSISGPDKVCPGDIATYSIAIVARAIRYNWSLPIGATILSGANSNIITVQYSVGFAGGTIGVSGVNGCGISPARTRIVTLNLLSAPVSITGPTSGMCGMTGVTYSLASNVIGAASYTWNVPVGVSIVGTNTGTSLLVDFNNTYVGGNITVAAVNNCGKGVTRSITVIAAPAFPSIIGGPLAICTNVGSGYSLSTITGTSNYIWTTTRGLTILSGQGTKNISLVASTVVTGQTITVKASNLCGTSNTRVLDNISASNCPRIGDDKSAFNLIAYPNPVTDKLTVEFYTEKEEIYSVRLFDSTGRLILAEVKTAISGTNQKEICVRGISSGIYILQFKLNDKTEQIRVVIE